MKAAGRNTAPFDPNSAWLRAAAYFTGCWILALVGGALPVAGKRVVAADDAWWWLTALVFVAAVIGYWAIWPLGTDVGDRALHYPWAAGFGVVWGISEGVLLLAIWAAVERAISSPVLAALVAFVVIGGVVAAWHAIYWDTRIAPEHNIQDWNVRKVVFVHAPFLLAGVMHLARYGQGRVFLAAYTVALTGAAVGMRMPPPSWRPHRLTPECGATGAENPQSAVTSSDEDDPPVPAHRQ